MATALKSKPGITGATSLSIPKDWDPTWFRNFIANMLKGADVRNATGVNGITVSGTIASPYATITVGGSSAPLVAPIIINRSDGVTAGTTFGANGNVTIAAPSSGAALTVTGSSTIGGVLTVSGNANQASGYGANLGIVTSDTGSASRFLFGDGTGWSLAFSKRTGGVTTDLVTIKDAGNVTIAAPSSGISLTVTQTSGAGKQAGAFGSGLSTCYSVFTGSLCVGTEGGDYPSVGYNWNPQSLGADNYLVGDFASRLQFKNGGFLFQTAPSGTAGNAITFTTRVTIAQTGLMTVTPGATNGELLATSAALTSGAGSSAGTLTNAPSVGNPTKWIKINDNGTIRSIPAW